MTVAEDTNRLYSLFSESAYFDLAFLAEDISSRSVPRYPLIRVTTIEEI